MWPPRLLSLLQHLVPEGCQMKRVFTQRRGCRPPPLAARNSTRFSSVLALHLSAFLSLPPSSVSHWPLSHSASCLRSTPLILTEVTLTHILPVIQLTLMPITLTSPTHHAHSHSSRSHFRLFCGAHTLDSGLGKAHGGFQADRSVDCGQSVPLVRAAGGAANAICPQRVQFVCGRHGADVAMRSHNVQVPGMQDGLANRVGGRVMACSSGSRWTCRRLRDW